MLCRAPPLPPAIVCQLPSAPLLHHLNPPVVPPAGALCFFAYCWARPYIRSGLGSASRFVQWQGGERALGSASRYVPWRGGREGSRLRNSLRPQGAPVFGSGDGVPGVCSGREGEPTAHISACTAAWEWLPGVCVATERPASLVYQCPWSLFPVPSPQGLHQLPLLVHRVALLCRLLPSALPRNHGPQCKGGPVAAYRRLPGNVGGKGGGGPSFSNRSWRIHPLARGHWQ